MHRKENYFHARQSALENYGCFRTGHNGHGQIEQNQIGLELLGFLDGLHAVRGLATDVIGSTALYVGLKQIANVGIIVADEDFADGGNWLITV